MSLYDEIREASRPSRARCTVGQVIASLDEQDAASLVAALGDPAVTGAGIAKVLNTRGHKVAASTVQRHRRGECDCD